MKKILVPSDFSRQSQQAYKFAMDIAEAGQGEVLVLKVNDLPFTYERTIGVHPAWHDPGLEFELAEKSKRDYETMKSMFPKDTVPVTFLVERGNVTETILKVIESHNIDLVIMGKQGAGGFEDFLIGSNTLKLVRTSPVPVIALRNAPDFESIKNIVFPSTLELNQDIIIEKVKQFQDFFKAALHVILVNHPSKFLKENEIKDKIENFSRHYQLINHTLNVRSDEDEYEGILHFAEEIHADMIFMRTHGRKGIYHLLSGSIAEDLINHVPYPVCTYKVKN